MCECRFSALYTAPLPVDDLLRAITKILHPYIRSVFGEGCREHIIYGINTTKPDVSTCFVATISRLLHTSSLCYRSDFHLRRPRHFERLLESLSANLLLKMCEKICATGPSWRRSYATRAPGVLNRASWLICCNSYNGDRIIRNWYAPFERDCVRGSLASKNVVVDGGSVVRYYCQVL